MDTIDSQLGAGDRRKLTTSQSPWPSRVLMVQPEHFRVDYAINPYMTNSSGQLNLVDSKKAIAQWLKLKETFESLGLEVLAMPAHPEFPDMVFCANQTFPFLDQEGKTGFIIGKMRHDQRQGETQIFKDCLNKNGFSTFTLGDFIFEGAGDALWNYETSKIYAGYGFRSDSSVYSQLGSFLKTDVVSLRLVSEDFYHLDTCLTVLNRNTAAYVPSAFDQLSREVLKREFSVLIEIDLAEARFNFAGNATCVDGQSVVLQKGSSQYAKDLKNHGFFPIEVSTDEFMKSGGSVFCLKQLF